MHTYLPRLSTMRTAAGCFFMKLKNFQKPPLNVEQHLALLCDRGLLIPNKESATQTLNTISYYRLSAYCKPFQDANNHFIKGTSLDQIIELYTFDRKLRLLIADAIERVEVAFRSAISNVMSMHHGALWYMQKDLFKTHNRYRNNFHTILLQNINDICSHPKEDFLQHFYRQYSQTYPPSWMIIECLSFGTLSLMFKNLNAMCYKKQIANLIGMPCTILESWIESLVFTRNLCAHHSRLWNRWFIVRPKMLQEDKDLPANTAHTIYEHVVILKHLLQKIHPESTWLTDLYDLFAKYPRINKALMGFEKDFYDDKIWLQDTSKIAALA